MKCQIDQEEWTGSVVFLQGGHGKEQVEKFHTCTFSRWVEVVAAKFKNKERNGGNWVW